MGFGGGSFGSGGDGGSDYRSFHDDDDDRDSFSRYSDSSSCSQNRECDYIYMIAIGFTVSMVFIGLTIFALASESYKTTMYCANGETLNADEQMWCVPPEETTITAHPTNSIKVFRAKKSDLSLNVTRNVNVTRTDLVDGDHYKYYSFILNPGSFVTASLTSSSSAVDCYLLNDDSMRSFRMQTGFNYTAHGKGSLYVDSFSPNKSDCFYFIFSYESDPSSNPSQVEFDMFFSYKLYDVSSLKPVCENNETCKLKNVETDEIIIADNNGSVEHSVTLNLPGEIRVLSLVIICIFLTVFIVIVGVLTFLSVMLCSGKCKKSSKGEQKSLVQSTPDSSTPGSSTSE